MQHLRILVVGAFALGASLPASRASAEEVTVVAAAAPRLGDPPPPSSPGEIQLGAAVGGEGSTWRGDGAGFVGIRTGFRFLDIAGPYFLARMGYATVNQRWLEMIQIGGQVWARIGITRPYLRLGLTHQHEEPWPSVTADYLGAFIGVADGIRHRSGFEGALGVDIPFKQLKAWQFHATVEGFTSLFPDARGPRLYGGGTLGVGANFTIFDPRVDPRQ
jgi:hypothetical protein